MSDTFGESPEQAQRLLLSVAEQLKTPLMQIARSSEQAVVLGEDSTKAIRETADTAIRLIDHFVLGIRLGLEADNLPVEPVAASAILYDTGQQLSSLARRYGVDLQLKVDGRFQPVLTHREGLQAALVSLGASLIEALPAQETGQLSLQLATHRCRYGIVAGLYADTPLLTAQELKRGQRLHGQSRQPFFGALPGTGAGIFVAESILRSMQLRLSASKHQGLHGWGAILQPAQQLRLV